MLTGEDRQRRKGDVRQTAAAFIILLWISLTSPVPARAQAIGAACSVAAGSTVLNNGLLLVCNGSTWVLGEGFASSGNVGIGTASPASALDVNGDIRSETGTAAAGGSCSPNGATVAATYNAGGENLICTSGEWAVVSSAGSSCSWHSTAFTTVGGNTWTYPSGTVQAVWAFLVGGGGGGGSSASSLVFTGEEVELWAGGGGGGGGGISWAQIPATGNLTVTIGAGGTGGTGTGNTTNGFGTQGGNTTVAQSGTVLLSAGGGQGGPWQETANGVLGGNGGVGNFGNAGMGSFYAGANGNGAAGGGANVGAYTYGNSSGAYVDGYPGGNSAFASGGFAGSSDDMASYTGGGGGASWGAGANGSSSGNGSSASANTGGGGGGAVSYNATGSFANGGSGGSGYAVIWACY